MKVLPQVMGGVIISNALFSINFITENRNKKIVNDYTVVNVSCKVFKIIF
jgi:hypothetical protein